MLVPLSTRLQIRILTALLQTNILVYLNVRYPNERRLYIEVLEVLRQCNVVHFHSSSAIHYIKCGISQSCYQEGSKDYNRYTDELTSLETTYGGLRVCDLHIDLPRSSPIGKHLLYIRVFRLLSGKKKTTLQVC